METNDYKEQLKQSSEAFNVLAKSFKTIENSEKNLKELLDAMPQKITTADPEGNVLFFNKQWLDDTGYTFEELKGWGWEKAMHPEDLGKTIKNWQHSVGSGELFDMECRIMNTQGDYIWHLSRASPIKDENGDIKMWVGTNTDIHEQKGKKDQLKKAVFERTKELEEMNLVLAFENKEKEKRAAELIIANAKLIVQNNEKVASAVHLKNINLELTEAHSSLRKFNAELEETVKERTYELGKSNTHLRRVNTDLDNFIYTASHDLKAPINNIEGLVQLLITEIPDNKWESHNIIDKINDSILRFKKTIFDLTEVAKIQKGDDSDVELLNFKEITLSVKEDISNLIKEGNVTLLEDYSKVPEINFSRKNLRSILYNLLSNAIKYRSPDRQPIVEISTYIDEADFIVISVKDNGLGMREADKEKVFDMFKRLHTHVEGTGIGMTIVKRIVSNADGKIEVESELNVGTTFKIYLNRKNQ